MKDFPMIRSVKAGVIGALVVALPLPLLTGPLLAAAMALLLSSRPVARGFQMLQNLPPPSRKSK